MRTTSIYADLATAAVEAHPPEQARAIVQLLPITMRPTLNQQLRGWESQFPYERRRLLNFLRGMQSFSPEGWASLTRPLVDLEAKMGVSQWGFSEEQDTMENASHLARSAYYIQWREQVQKVFQAIEDAAANSLPAAPHAPRLLLLVLPENLPVDAPSQWRPWHGRGQAYAVADGARGLAEQIVQGRGQTPSLAALLAQHTPAESSDLWLIDAEARLPAQDATAAQQLHYSRILGFRDRFLEQVNTMPKDLAVSDRTLDAVRHQNWERWCPEDLKAQPRLRNFLVDLFLSGNGALIYPSAFAEWASSEAIRRARPRVLVTRFGMRSKPKPFTGIAIFENQKRINTLPDVDDPEGSAIDAQLLARYVWLAAERYPEHEQTACLCIAEHCNAVYLIAPEGKAPGWPAGQPVAADEMHRWVAGWLAG